MAADDDLSRGVVVGHRADLVVIEPGARRLGGNGARRLDLEAEQRRHRALADRHRALHRLSAQLQQPRRVANRKRAGRGQRRIFAERMPGDKGDVPAEVEPAFGFEHPDRREARRHQRRLGVFGQRQLALRPLEHQPREVLRQRVVDLVEKAPRRRKGAGEAAPHADRLRALPRKYQCTLHRRHIPPFPLAGIDLKPAAVILSRGPVSV